MDDNGTGLWYMILLNEMYDACYHALFLLNEIKWIKTSV